MDSVGMLIRLQARSGKEADVEAFLEGVMPLIRQEPATTTFLGFRLAPGQYGIVNSFPDAAGRAAHEHGPAAEALFGRADELFDRPPSVEPIAIVSQKSPGGSNDW